MIIPRLIKVRYIYSIILGWQHISLLDRSIPDQPELLIDSSAKCHFLTDPSANGIVQLDLHDILHQETSTS